MNTSFFHLGESRPGRYLRSLLAPETEAPLAVVLPAARQHKILVVDDDPVILKTLSLKLATHGYSVVTATDASSAIGALRDERPDLVLLDLDFPPDIANGGRVTWDGFQIMSWLRGLQESEGLPFIFMTASTSAAHEQRALASGAVAFFQKPIRHAELLQTLQEALARRNSPAGCQPA